jgi:predicted deacylase
MRLLQHACTADIVLDLHCCFDASKHLFTLPSQAQVPPAAPTPKQHHKPLTTTQMFTSLSSRLGCAAVLTADISGGNSFDEACSLPWHVLSRLYPNAGFNAETCASCTSDASKMQHLYIFIL